MAFFSYWAVVIIKTLLLASFANELFQTTKYIVQEKQSDLIGPTKLNGDAARLVSKATVLMFLWNLSFVHSLQVVDLDEKFEEWADDDHADEE